MPVNKKYRYFSSFFMLELYSNWRRLLNSSDVSPIDITAEYKYDIYGRRIQKNVNGSTNYPPILADLIGLSPKGIITNFAWEGDNISLELDSSNQPVKKYFTETSMDDYFGHLEYSEVTNWSKIFDYSYPQGWYGYLKDQVGTIYRVWDRNLKQYAETRTYDTFGNMINFTGSTKTNLGFQGKYYDTESRLNYFYHRYYSPSIGRFISEDPIGIRGGLNLNQFVGNNPINAVDFFGEMILLPPGLRPCGYPEEPFKIGEKDDKCKKNCTKQSWAECYSNCINKLTGNLPQKLVNAILNNMIQKGIQNRLPTECAKSVFQSNRSVATRGILIFGAWTAGASYGCMISCLLNPCNW